MFITLCGIFFSYSFKPTSVQLSLGAAQAQNNRRAEADRLQQQGEQQLEAGQYVQGTETLERAMRIYQEIGDTETYEKLLNRIYFLYYSRGAYDKLKPLISEITALHSDEQETEQRVEVESEFDPKVQKLLIQGLSQEFQKENYTVARTYFEQALSRAKAIGSEKEQIRVSTYIAKSYLYEKKYANALSSLELAQRLSEKRYRQTAQQANSSDINQKADHFREMRNHRLPVLLLTGEIYLQNDNPDKALTYFEEASEIATKIEEQYQKFMVSSGGVLYFEDPSLYLSRAHYNLRNYEQALTYARKAIKKGESIQSPNDAPLFMVSTGDLGKGHGHVLAGIALEKLGQLEQAEKELKQAIQIFETTRNESTLQGSINESLKLFNNQVRATSFLQRVLLAKNQPEEALAAAEWGRARLLVETATAPKELTIEEKVDAFVESQYTPEGICEETRNYLPEANVPEGFEHIFVSPHRGNFECDGEAQMEMIKEGYLEAARQSPELLDMITGATASSDVQPPNIAQLKQIAQSRQATVVEYSIISETTFFHNPRQEYTPRNIFSGKEQKLVIWVIQPTGEIQLRQIDLKAQDIDIEELVKNTRQTMGLGRAGIAIRPSPEQREASRVQVEQQLKQLHQLLIQPISDLLPSDPEAKVVFVPHKELFLVPFAALIDSKNEYLIDKYTITTAPSIQTLEVTRQKQQKTVDNQKAVVVGNPIMPSIPSPADQPPTQLSSLPGAQEEARKIAQLLNTQFLTGNQATEAEVLQRLPQAQYIHLATHGLLDDYAGFGIPGALALAPSSGDDGFLTSSEIQELNLSAELAVLSACDTGRGDITGDGVVGLSRALIIAGVPSVVVSLWSVPDAPTAELMVEFYRNFQERGLDKAQALRQAMLKMKETNPNPVNWAGFTLIGETE
jgi:CHAT domain-containing protein/tetratricopeptide (TPR) repeat protein